MTINIVRGNSDAVIDEIVAALDRYEVDHPTASIDLYRQNSVSVRVRIIDPTFQGMGRTQRSQLVWQYLSQLSDEVQSDISTVLPLSPDEAKMSFASFEFDDPIPSKL